ncbi:hypothetical protein BVRB_4g087790 isoform B [Beta vulgaris subsp. vulgaris]|nr:hypothetical protein BVRB_4g087790 isoform B [Beta vulgaris subsp. vulgaris]
MTPTNDKKEGNFIWTDDDMITFCDILIASTDEKVKGRAIKWVLVQDEFEKRTKRKCPIKSMKNKYDWMRRDWQLWKFLKTGETGLGWDPTTGKIKASIEWWEKKIMEKPEVKKFRNKGIAPEIEDLWNRLYQDGYATGEHVVSTN